MKFTSALILGLVILIVGNVIVYYVFQGWFRADYPANYTFPHVSIYSYGFMLMLSFVVGAIWFVVQGRKASPPVEADTILDLMVFIIVGSIIGARIVYVLTQWGDFKDNLKAVFQITQGGLSIHGGIIGALIFGWFYIKAKGLDFWKIVDLAIPGVGLGLFIGRIGCFLNGCCYGIKCADDFPLRVKFPSFETWTQRGLSADLARLYDAGQAAMGDFYRHPAQLYESIGALAIFFYLSNFRKHALFKGHVFLMFVWLYSLLRLIVEFYRFGDPEKGIGSSVVLWKFITMAQLASIILAAVAYFLMVEFKRRVAMAKMMVDEKVEAVEEVIVEEPEEESMLETEVEESIEEPSEISEMIEPHLPPEEENK